MGIILRMNWIEKSSSFRYAGKPVTRTKLAVNTILGEFSVFEAVNGNVFIRHPFLDNYYIGAFGFNNGCQDWFGAPKKQVKTLEEGKEMCEQAMLKAKSIINNY